MLGIIGIKIGMTNIFIKDINTECTIIKAGPCLVTQIKNLEKDKYLALQLGYIDKKKNINNPLKGHFNKFGISPKKILMEFKVNDINNFKVGDCINIDIFYEGENVNITSISKGKGFQGVVKRHKFSGVGEKTHGQHNRLRSPGSIGAGSDPSRVFKGTKMAGRMGGKKVTSKNIKILKIDINNNIIIVKGSIPGNNYSYIKIKKWM